MKKSKTAGTASAKSSQGVAVKAAPVRAQTKAASRNAMIAAYSLCAIAIAFLLYGPALHGPFLFDDRYLPFLSLDLIAKPIGAWFVGLRPLVNLSFWFNAQISGSDPWSYHAGNVILHALNSVLVYLIARWFLQRVNVPADRREWLALVAGALFLVHPLQTEAVAYVTSRSETLAVSFFYSAFALFLYRRDRGLTWGWTFVVLALFAASQLTKEYAAVFPFLLLLTDWIFPARRGLESLTPVETMRQNWRVYSVMLVGVAIGGALIAHVLAGTTSAGFRLKEVGPVDYFLTECRAIWDYLRLAVWPFGQNIDPDFHFTHGAADPLALAGFVALLAGAAAAIYFRSQYRLASFGFLAMLLCLAPTSSFLPIADPFAEHRMYLPMIGLVLVLLEVLWRIKRVERGTLLAVTFVRFGCVCLSDLCEECGLGERSCSLAGYGGQESPAKYGPDSNWRSPITRRDAAATR